MKYLLAILLMAMPLSDLDKIATVNKHKKEAKEAYNNGNYEEALEHYKFLVDSLKVSEPEVMLNLSNTYYQLKDTSRAVEGYSSLYDTSDKEIRSVANQQLGIVYNKMLQKPQEALQYFKEALKSNPLNEDARYNYELLKKALKDQENQDQDQNEDKEQNKDDQQKDQEKKDENKEQQNKDQQDQEQKQDQESDQKKQDQEGKEGEDNQEEQSKDQEQEDSKEKKEEEQKQQQKKQGEEGESDEQDDQENQDLQNSVAEKLKDMKISEEKARMILEAMKNNEIQYFQQNKRKPTKRKNPSKPDW